MPCIKTGAQIYLENYGEFCWCDAFELGDVAYFRIVQRSREPLSQAIGEVWYVVNDFDNWYDKEDPLSTLISNNFRKIETRAARFAEEANIIARRNGHA